MTVNWSKQAILFALRERGTTAAEVARQAGVSREFVYGGLVRPSPKVHGLIAAALGVSRQTIWPQYYDAEGNRTGLINARKVA